jgi:hypothetical protein
MERATSEWDKSVFVWCIENHVPLSAASDGRMHVAFYEDFCVDPEGELRRLLSYVGKPFDPAALGALSKPSATIRKDSAVVLGRDPLDAWRHSVSATELTSAMEIVGLFGLDRIYGPGPMPKWRPGR